MDYKTIFTKTLGFIGGSKSHRRQFTVDFHKASTDEMLATTQQEAADCKEFLEKLFKAPRIEKAMFRVVQYLQEQVEDFLFACSYLMQQPETPHVLPDEAVDFCDNASEALCEVLEQISDLFNTYMNRDKIMPNYYLDNCYFEFEQLWNLVFREEIYPDPVMKEMAWLKNCFEIGEFSLPDAQLRYSESEALLMILAQADHIINDSQPEEEMIKKLRLHFWNQNFNHPDYVKFVADREISTVKDLPPEEQIHAIVKVINRVRRRSRITQGGFQHKAPLKDAVMARLNNHLDGLKLKISITRFMGEALPPQGKMKRLQLNIPTQKLGFLLRYLHEKEIIKGVDPPVLINFVCTFLQPPLAPKHNYDILSTAFHAEPIISEYNAKRILEPKS